MQKYTARGSGGGGSSSSTPNSRPDRPRRPPEGPWSPAPRELSESPTSSSSTTRALPGAPRALQLRSTGAQGKGASRVRSEIKVALRTSCCTVERPVHGMRLRGISPASMASEGGNRADTNDRRPGGPSPVIPTLGLRLSAAPSATAPTSPARRPRRTADADYAMSFSFLSGRTFTAVLAGLRPATSRSAPALPVAAPVGSEAVPSAVRPLAIVLRPRG